MPKYTLDHKIGYPIAADLVKDSLTTSRLASDLERLATTTDQALTVSAEGAVNSAKEYADSSKWALEPTVLTSSADIWNLAPGLYRPVGNAEALAMGLPTANIGDLSVKNTGANGKILTWTPVSSIPRFFTNRRVGRTIWSGWDEFTPAMKSAGGVEREMRVARAGARRGGTYGTNGVAVLCLVYDHGTNNFISKVLPIHQQAGVPAVLGLNAGMYDPRYIFRDSDNQTTFAQVQTMALNNGVSLWNHGDLHAAGAESEILGGRDKLQASLPRVPIENWLHTGLYGDFESGNTFAKYWEHDIGKTIMNGHAYLTGDIQEPIKPLTGQLKPGYDGEWIDAGASPLARVKALVQQAQKVGGAVMTRQHPMYLDTAGYITTTQLRDFILWAAAERDAGRLLILTADLLNVADASSSTRRNLTDGTGGTDNQTRTISLTDNTLARGSVCELHATVKLTTAGSVKLTAIATNLTATRTITVAANTWVDLRQFFTIPLDSTGNLTVEVERVTGTGLTVHQLNVYPG